MSLLIGRARDGTASSGTPSNRPGRRAQLKDDLDLTDLRSVVFLVFFFLLAEGGCQPVGQCRHFGIGETRLGMGQ